MTVKELREKYVPIRTYNRSGIDVLSKDGKRIVGRIEEEDMPTSTESLETFDIKIRWIPYRVIDIVKPRNKERIMYDD
jgi:hypothetical protein